MRLLPVCLTTTDDTRIELRNRASGLLSNNALRAFT